MINNFKGTQGKRTTTYKWVPLGYQQISQQKFYRTQESGITHWKYKKIKLSAQILYPAKLSLKIWRIKAFTAKQRPREFIKTKFALKEMLKGALLSEIKRQKYTKLWVRWKTHGKNQKIAALYQNTLLNSYSIKVKREKGVKISIVTSTW